MSRIVGGVAASENSWPWITRLFLRETIGSGGGRGCGGTIIHNNWVLSAAHCCEDMVEIYATFGDIDSDTYDSDQYFLRSTEFYNHPEYGNMSDGTGANSDWCLIKFDNNIIAADPEKKTRIACLPDAEPDHGEACWTAGWGLTSPGGTTGSDELVSVGVNIMSQEYCTNKSYYGKILRLVADDICVGVPDLNGDNITDGGKSPCQALMSQVIEQNRQLIEESGSTLAGCLMIIYGIIVTFTKGKFSKTARGDEEGDEEGRNWDLGCLEAKHLDFWRFSSSPSDFEFAICFWDWTEVVSWP
ncbi:Oidioi.mRNA.OKI2018_I69.chr2.g4304.t1.cds [Oikopleura dioica]|uniref:Oidioi.mRNA.OKI2018_I69.chr2.g4304.t1.cds n=1 Tax=Oikopleura dioica TaxID=34765 RepID=A0ABN7T3I6_OIKDI|nr:Oidioi.mRNA.OKI2018_I69.chr2.g4304.t1.cds [Oikopleura dioica]